MKLPCQVKPGLQATPRRSSVPMNQGDLPAGCRTIANRQSPIGNRQFPPSRSGVALVATLIMLSLVTFMVVAFLGVAWRERRAIEASTTAGEARVASDAAFNFAQADLLARLLISGDKWNYGVMVSTNYENLTGFAPAVSSPTNVNHTNAMAAGLNPWLVNLGNLQYKPRVPVFSPGFTNTRAFPAPGLPNNVLLSESRAGRFSLDFNRNGIFDPTDRHHPGDPHWIGLLEYPDVQHGPTNRFLSRYAYLIAPAGKALDLNLVHNQAKRIGAVNSEGYYRNLGVGPHEINLAAMLTELAPAYYLHNYDLNPANPSFAVPNGRDAFRDALLLLRYRNNDSYNNPATLAAQFGATPAQFLTNANFDVLGNGGLMNSTFLTTDADPTNVPWPGGTNTHPQARRYFDLTELFSATRPNYQPFTTNLHFLSTNLAPTLAGDADRRAPYRLMEVLGTESWPLTNKLNLNWPNTLAGSPGGEAFGFTNWHPDVFFYSAAELMLRASLTPSVFVNTNWTGFGGAETNVLVTNYYFGTTFVGTNINATLSVTNIPIFPFSYYLPETHRLLQLAANLHDATFWDGYTPAYPTVWRPVFGFANTNLWPTNDFINIVGYTTNGTDAATLLGLPVYDLSDPNARMQMYNTAGGTIGASNLCLFAGTPVILGVKKGYPNFNEFGVQTRFSVTRRLEFIKSAATNNGPMAASNPRPVQTNQSLVVGLTNIYGFEAWNSYYLAYPRALTLLATNIARIVVTNEFGPIYTNVTTNGLSQAYAAGAWAGTSNGFAAFKSFFFTNVPQLSTNVALGYAYATNYPPLPGFTNGGFIPASPTGPGSPSIFNRSNGFPDLRLGISITNSIIFALVDSNRVVDFVNLTNLVAGMDLATALRVTNGAATPQAALQDPVRFWFTNRVGAAPFGQTLGVSNQVEVCTNFNAGSTNLWRNWSLNTPIAREIDRFRRWMGLSGVPGLNPNQYLNTNILVVQSPFNPTRTIAYNATWEVNDPLVHHTTRDISDPYRTSTGDQVTPIVPPIAAPPPPGTLYRVDFGLVNGRLSFVTNGGLNRYYNPWGRGIDTTGTRLANLPGYYNVAPAAYDQRLKDAGVVGSDMWDFPQRKFANLGWIGRVHRGTPWQTFYLKSDIPNPTNWFYWARSTDTNPTNDWRLVDVFTTAVNADATRGLLSVNQTNSLAWAAALGGTLVLSNNTTTPANWPLVVAPASAQLTNIVGSLSNGLINAKHRIPMWQPVANYSSGDMVGYASNLFGNPLYPVTVYYRAVAGTNQNQNPLLQISTNYLAYWNPLASWTPVNYPAGTIIERLGIAYYSLQLTGTTAPEVSPLDWESDPHRASTVWNNALAYPAGTFVERLGITYYALTATPAGVLPEANPLNWAPCPPQRSFGRVGGVLSTPELSVQSPYLNSGRTWQLGTAYGVGARVRWLGWYYQAIRPVPLNTPPNPHLNYSDPRTMAQAYWWPLEFPSIARNAGTVDALNDVFVERLPQQTLGLLHLEEHPRMVIYALGQSVRPAERGVHVAGGAFSLMVTNYQVTGEYAVRAVVRVEGLPEPGLLPRPLPAGAPPVVTPRVFIESFKQLPEF
jgi:hypothetical protein